MVYSTDRSKTVVQVLVLLFVALWFVLRGNLFFCLTLLFCSCVFQSFKHCDYFAWGRERERANLSAVRTFVRFALVWFCLFSLPLGVWEWFRFVIVALPGLFSYLFSVCNNNMEMFTALISCLQDYMKFILTNTFLIDLTSSLVNECKEYFKLRTGLQLIVEKMIYSL